MPAPESLPDSLQPFLFFNAVSIDVGKDFEMQMATRLEAHLDRILASE